MFPGPISSSSGASGNGAARSWLAAAALVALVAAVYSQVGGHAFVDFDDNRYVFENPTVRLGLTKQGLAWALTALHASNWHPLTWLSHMADVEMFGLDAGWHHRVNVLWHALDTVMLFLVLRMATASVWRSAFAAALFAAHPLHVESVAWVAERKDVLSTFFWLLAMAAYVFYARRPGVARYLAVAGALALGLMSKPMLVTLPLVLLLLDLWPLGRVSPGTASLSSILPLVGEKVPLLALSALSSAVTYLAQARGGTVSATESLPMPLRVSNALVSCASYLAKMLWPTSLAVFYPHPGLSPGGIPGWRVALSVLALAGISALVLWQWRRRPALAVGWLWYLVALVPVIGLVQVGLQGMADRYTYVPSIGIFIAVAWAIPGLAEASRLRRNALACSAIAIVLAAAALARTQAETWQNSFTLFKHASEVTAGNWLAWKNLGVEYFKRGQYGPAIQAFRESLRARPDDADTWLDLAMCHAAVGEHALAADGFERALRLNPGDEEAWFNLGIAHALQGQPERASEVLDRLRRMSPAKAEDLEHRMAEIGKGGP